MSPFQNINDANGNVATKSEGSNFWRYTWDYENRLTQASTRKQTVRYKFDALGRRVQRYVGSENTKFIYDGDDVMVDDSSGTQARYQNGPGIDNKLRQTTSSTTSYFLADHLGSTNGLADSTGALTASNSYDSFGNSSNTNFPSRYQFTGRESDKFTGLQYSRARFYDPNLGRFISEDPIGFGGGDVNLYGYVRNNPQNWRDPLGLCPYCYWGDNPYDIIPEAGWTGIGHVGNLSAGIADTVTIGATRYIRQAQGVDDFIDPCSGFYFAGEVTGTVLPLFAGGAGAARNALAMGGRSGSLTTRLGRGSRRFVYDNRSWGSVRRDYWKEFGPATPNHIHHWMFPQRATEIPQGIRNAGFNQMVLPASLNSWMGYSSAGRVVEAGITGAVPAVLVGGAVAGGNWGIEREKWKSGCGCR